MLAVCGTLKALLKDKAARLHAGTNGALAVMIAGCEKFVRDLVEYGHFDIILKPLLAPSQLLATRTCTV